VSSRSSALLPRRKILEISLLKNVAAALAELESLKKALENAQTTSWHGFCGRIRQFVFKTYPSLACKYPDEALSHWQTLRALAESA
jgi:hypothetical protein